jgi:enamine deaminase RidA (YjgF/YER057c/UK114 family)
MSNAGHFHLSTPSSLPESMGYSQVAVVTGGSLVFVAGQVALDPAGNLVGESDFGTQAHQVFRNLRAALESVGASMRDLIKLNSYFLDPAHLPVLRKVRDEYIDITNPPASTAVQVARLFRPELLLEIEAVGVIPATPK